MTRDHGEGEGPPATDAGAPQPAEGLVDPARRRLLARVSVGLGCGCGLLAVPFAGFVLSPLLRAVPRVWRTVGRADDFRRGETVVVDLLDSSPVPWSGITAHTAAWLRCDALGTFVAFSVNCTHLGCPVRWLPNANLFMCPCHGGVYYADGAVAAGPPPHALWQYPVRVSEGLVQVRADPIPVG